MSSSATMQHEGLAHFDCVAQASCSIPHDLVQLPFILLLHCNPSGLACNTAFSMSLTQHTHALKISCFCTAAHSMQQCKEECVVVYDRNCRLCTTAVSCCASLCCLLLSSAALPVTSTAIDTVLLTTKQASISFIIINSATVILKLVGIRTHSSKDLIQP